MQRLNRLTARAVATLKKPGRHADGGGLYLKIDKSGAKRWTFMWMRPGRQREAGLGSVKAVTLAKAREIAAGIRAHLAEDHDPIESRRAARAEKQGRKTFGDVADTFLEAKSLGLHNAKHRIQWRTTLETYAKPIWHKPVDAIDTAAILEILKPIWETKPEQASRVRARIESILDAAQVQALRNADNPARWKGNLNKLLPPAKKLSKGHYEAMPYAEIPGFMTRLREGDSITARALEFLILTASRTSEVLGAQLTEIDFTRQTWTVPASRMKAKREHRVPLAARAVEILKRLAEVRTGDFVFRGQRLDKPLSNMALEMVLRRMKAEGATVHGFRSSFRDWCGEETHFPREIAEAALAHVIGNAAEQAYRRGDALEKRRTLMDSWAEFLSPAHQYSAVVATNKLRRTGL
jgi:integrase